jgi:hypothetical protein
MFNFRDPRIIHISVEILVIVAFIFWITSKNKQTTFFIRNILQRLDEQEERLLKLEARLASVPAPVKFVAPEASVPARPQIEHDETPTLSESLDDDLKEELAELNDQLSKMGEAL